MKQNLFLLASVCVLLSACEADRGGAATTDATNTGRNVRDRNPQAMTPGDQKENEMDRTITQKIRQAIVADNALSTNAKNIKIITANGIVTLRGPVNSDREKHEIARKASSVAGVRNVDNLLEVVRTENAEGR